MFVIRRVQAMSPPRQAVVVAVAIAVVALIPAALVQLGLFNLEDQGARQTATIVRQGNDIHTLSGTVNTQATDIHRLTLAVAGFEALTTATTPEERAAALAQIRAQQIPAQAPTPPFAGFGSPPGPIAAPAPAPSSTGTPNSSVPSEPGRAPAPSKPSNPSNPSNPSTGQAAPAPAPQPPPPSSPPPGQPAPAPAPAPSPPPPPPPPCRVSLPVVGCVAH